jgi:hypothetical protein
LQIRGGEYCYTLVHDCAGFLKQTSLFVSSSVDPAEVPCLRDMSLFQ